MESMCPKRYGGIVVNQVRLFKLRDAELGISFALSCGTGRLVVFLDLNVGLARLRLHATDVRPWFLGERLSLNAWFRGERLGFSVERLDVIDRALLLTLSTCFIVSYSIAATAGFHNWVTQSARIRTIDCLKNVNQPGCCPRHEPNPMTLSNFSCQLTVHQQNNYRVLVEKRQTAS